MNPSSVWPVGQNRRASSDVRGRVKFLRDRDTNARAFHGHPQRQKICQRVANESWHAVWPMHILQARALRVITIGPEKRIVLDRERERGFVVRKGVCGG